MSKNIIPQSDDNDFDVVTTQADAEYKMMLHTWNTLIDQAEIAANEALQISYQSADTPEKLAYLETLQKQVEAGYTAKLQILQHSQQQHANLKMNSQVMANVMAELKAMRAENSQLRAEVKAELEASVNKRMKKAVRDAYREGQWDAVRSGQVRASNVKRY